MPVCQYTSGDVLCTNTATDAQNILYTHLHCPFEDSWFSKEPPHCLKLFEPFPSWQKSLFEYCNIGVIAQTCVGAEMGKHITHKHVMEQQVEKRLTSFFNVKHLLSTPVWILVKGWTITLKCVTLSGVPNDRVSQARYVISPSPPPPPMTGWGLQPVYKLQVKAIWTLLGEGGGGIAHW